ncbi:serine/threonine-protein phosphatase [Streptomyces sp. PLK6-54]|uniref:Serine/threonine-protein phosphatase n=2 Tax=Actinacidiphila acidipaludis TaxID=2873382 RepID=A0ABS7PZD5_9ACTN|nr:serine/threonine-protein phosphatase [Streptomyces acidipaludis]
MPTAVREPAGHLLLDDRLSLERGLLPAPVLGRDGFRAAAHYEPGRAQALLSGDFYDVVQSEDSTVHAIIGDVSGHGPAEAALAVHLRLAWRTAVLCGRTQLQQMGMLERILVQERTSDETFATVVSLRFPPGGHSVTAVNAGHPGIILRRSREVRWVEPQTGIALGFFPGHEDWVETRIELSPRDGVVLLTDGVFEGRTGRATRLGEEGLLRLAARRSHLPAQEFIDALVGDAAAMAAPFGGLSDDVAVLQLGWNVPG